MLLGGVGGESLGTGWGNIQAVHYGRVQQALCDPDTLLISVSCLVGPFLLQPTVGRPLGGWTWVPRLAGWVLGFGFYFLAAAALIRGGWSEAVAVTLGTACAGRLLAIGLRYVNYPGRLRSLTRTLGQRLAGAGAAPADVAALTQQVLRNPGMDDAQTQALLRQAGLAPAGLGLSTLLDAWHTRGPGKQSLVRESAAAWERFHRLARPAGKLHAQDLSSVYALFTDLQTYVDQRSLAYARRTLGLIQQTLANAERR